MGRYGGGYGEDGGDMGVMGLRGHCASVSTAGLWGGYMGSLWGLMGLYGAVGIYGAVGTYGAVPYGDLWGCGDL